MRRNFCLGLLLLWLTAAPSLTVLSASQNLVTEIFSQGLDLYAAGDFRGAVDYLDQVVTMSPENDQARYYLIFSYSMSGRPKKGLEHAKILAARFPQNAQYDALVKQISRQLAVVADSFKAPSENNDSAKAIELQSLSIKPRISERKAAPPHEPTRIELAISMIDEEQYASATAALQKILKTEPRNAEAAHYMGVICFNKGDFTKAAEHFEKAIANGLQNFETRFLAGSCYLNQQAWETAEIHFKKALELKDDIFCKMNLAEIFCRGSRFKEAEQMFKGIQKSNPEVIDAGVGLAQINLEQGYSDVAAASINEILAAHPDSAKARFVKARILIENKLYAEAAEEAKLAFQSNPGNNEYRACYALALIRNFQVAPGLEEARAILEKSPGNIDAILALAEGLIVGGNLDAAETQLLQAEKSGKRPETSFLLAAIAVSKGDQAKARQFYEKFHKRAGNQPSALIEYARFLEAQGSVSEASQAYQSVISLYDGTPFASEAQTAIARLAHADSHPSVPQIGKIPIPGLNNP